jgi:DNA-binding GntR family transcriptional regulator
MVGKEPSEQSIGPRNGLRRPTRQSLASSIADSVAEAIAVRQLRPGERIVELALAERLGVSRVPVREALKVLHAQGIVTGGGHWGYRVADFDDETVRTIVDLRLVLEGILLRGAVRNWRRGEGDLSGLRAALDRMRTAELLGDRPAALVADLDFHRAIGAAAGNNIAATLWEALARHVLIIFNRPDYHAESLGSIVRHHEDFLGLIAEAVERGTPDADIERALRDHLLRVRGSPDDAAGG